MPSTYAWGTPPWMSGQHHWGHGSIGVPFSSLPTTGLNGPALGATDTGLAADDEILTRIITVPPLLTYFKCSELGEIEAEGVHMLSTSGMLKHVEAITFKMSPTSASLFMYMPPTTRPTNITTQKPAKASLY